MIYAMIDKKHRSTRAGLSLTEVMMALAIVGTVLSSAGLVAQTTTEAYRTGTARAAVETKLRQSLDRVASELSGAGLNTVWPQTQGNFWEPSLSFQRAQGLDEFDQLIWSPVDRIGCELDMGELDDGIDNDGDGLVDELALVLTRDVGGADEKRVVLCHGVSELLEGEEDNDVDDNDNDLEDEAGFCFQREDRILTIRLTLEAVDAEGARIQRTLETAVKLRN